MGLAVLASMAVQQGQAEIDSGYFEYDWGVEDSTWSKNGADYCTEFLAWIGKAGGSTAWEDESRGVKLPDELKSKIQSQTHAGNSNGLFETKEYGKCPWIYGSDSHWLMATFTYFGDIT